MIARPADAVRSRVSRSGASRRSGFTLVELLVVITIIGLLVGLLLPAVNAARDSARRATCLNNIKQLATAMINYQTSKQRIPGYVQRLKRNDGSLLQVAVGGLMTSSTLNSAADTPSTRDQSRISWAAIILPQLDQQSLYDTLLDGSVISGDPRAQIPALEFLVCPSDQELLSLPGSTGMTYVANTGSWDWFDTSGDLADQFNAQTFAVLRQNGGGDTRENGLFLNKLFDSTSVKLDNIKDGASTTIMLSENIHKEVDPSAEFRGETIPLYSWVGVGAFQPAEQRLGVVWLNNANPTANGAQVRFSVEELALDSFPHSSPVYARPGSGHNGGVFNVAFADGNARALSPDIDYTVYQQLMTPDGRKSTNVVNGAPSVFVTAAPLSSEDY